MINDKDTHNSLARALTYAHTHSRHQMEAAVMGSVVRAHTPARARVSELEKG